MISIIVPSYNSGDFLNECLQSILNQSYAVWECIIVNDGSTDHTADIAQSWVSKDSRFKYIFKTNGGLSSARNTGISEARYPIIFPLDADDYLSDNAFAKALQVIEKQSRWDVITLPVHYVGSKSGVYKLPEYSYKKLLVQNCFVACSFFKKESWSQIGGYDESLTSLEDWDFWIRLLNDNSSVFKVKNATYYYRQHDQDNLRSRFKKDPAYYYDLYDRIYSKNKDKYQMHFKHPIEVMNDNMILEAFVHKIKRTFVFRMYESFKKRL